jgi:hypothetical protein
MISGREILKARSRLAIFTNQKEEQKAFHQNLLFLLDLGTNLTPLERIPTPRAFKTDPQATTPVSID